MNWRIGFYCNDAPWLDPSCPRDQNSFTLMRRHGLRFKFFVAKYSKQGKEIVSNTGLEAACVHLAKQVLYGNGADSKDVVETLAAKFLSICEEHQDWVRRNRESDDVIENAVWYLAHVHAIPPMRTDTSWFSQAMRLLLELAVPNTGLTADSFKLIPQLQEGMAQTMADAPISSTEVRLEDSETKIIKMFEVAGSEYGRVSELLDLVERLYHADPLDTELKRFFVVAALAAPLVRRARIESGIDKEI